METVFASLPEFGIACAIFFIASAVYAMMGFGAGLIAVGTLALFLPVQDVVVMLLPLSMPVEMVVLYRSRRQLAFRSVLLLLVGVCVGVPLGAYVLSEGDAEFVLLILGVALAGFGAAFLGILRPRPIAPAWARRLEPLVGVIAGGLGSAFSISGPPLVLYFQFAGVNKAAFRSGLMLIFHVTGWARVFAYAAADLFTTARLYSIIAVLPAAIAGFVLGSRWHLNVSESAFRRLVSVALIAIGLMLVTSSLSR